MSRATRALPGCAVVIVAVLACQHVHAQAPQQGPVQGPSQQGVPQQQGALNQQQLQQIIANGPGPFQLTPAQQQDLDNLLNAWQNESAAIKTLTADFTLWEYNGVFVPRPGHNPNDPTRTEKGQIMFAAPDKGLYEILEPGGEKWICDGAAIYEFNATKQQLIERHLPPHMQGKAISDGPLPFVFGVQAAKMKQRYWLRVITPEADRGVKVWIEAFPKRQEDAANFAKAQIILDHKTLLPYAVELNLPNGKSRTVYLFDTATMSKNNPLHQLQNFLGVFAYPRTPSGWQRIVPKTQGMGPAAQAPQEGALR